MKLSTSYLIRSLVLVFFFSLGALLRPRQPLSPPAPAPSLVAVST
ncbi:MAG TPA: hypothetical protein VJU86_21485 [Pyrinomonadaceae bacterium]|nr:hypothetical protein [Pyrinomonadaceae bacterium]